MVNLTACMHSFVEHDGFARTLLMLLTLTTIGCFSYTWGYYEVRAEEKKAPYNKADSTDNEQGPASFLQGINNGKVNVLLDKMNHEQHNDVYSYKTKVNETHKSKFNSGHGMHYAKNERKDLAVTAPHTGALRQTVPAASAARVSTSSTSTSSPGRATNHRDRERERERERDGNGQGHGSARGWSGSSKDKN